MRACTSADHHQHPSSLLVLIPSQTLNGSVLQPNTYVAHRFEYGLFHASPAHLTDTLDHADSGSAGPASFDPNTRERPHHILCREVVLEAGCLLSWAVMDTL